MAEQSPNGSLQHYVLGAVLSFAGSYGMVWIAGFHDGIILGLFILYTVVLFSALGENKR